MFGGFFRVWLCPMAAGRGEPQGSPVLIRSVNPRPVATRLTAGATSTTPLRNQP